MNTIHNTAMVLAKRTHIWATRTAEQNGFTADLCGMCAIASSKFSSLLEENGIAHIIAGNDCHWFVIIEGHIYDITAKQFGYYGDVFRYNMKNKKDNTSRDIGYYLSAFDRNAYYKKYTCNSNLEFEILLGDIEWCDEQLPNF